MKKIKTKNFNKKIDMLNFRKTGIGGSDSPIIMGESKFDTPYSLYYKKQNFFPEQEDENERIFWGTQLEDSIRDGIPSLLKNSNLDVKTIKEKKTFYYDDPKTKTRYIANIDGWIFIDGEKFPLEIKTTGEYNKSQWENDKIPSYYFPQVQHYMRVLGYEKIYVFGLVGGNKLYTSVINYDDKYCKLLLEKQEEFWNAVKSENPPEPMGEDVEVSLSDVIYGNPITDELDKEEDEIISSYKSLSERITLLNKEKSEMRNKILIKSKTKNIFFEDLSAVIKKYESKLFNKEQLKKDLPDVYEKYVYKKENTKLTIKEQKSNEKK